MKFQAPVVSKEAVVNSNCSNFKDQANGFVADSCKTLQIVAMQLFSAPTHLVIRQAHEFVSATAVLVAPRLDNKIRAFRRAAFTSKLTLAQWWFPCIHLSVFAYGQLICCSLCHYPSLLKGRV
jgi:hypothetical protein